MGLNNLIEMFPTLVLIWMFMLIIMGVSLLPIQIVFAPNCPSGCNRQLPNSNLFPRDSNVVVILM